MERKNKKARQYAHFDKRISLNESTWKYISNPSNISKHSFYPFIHFTQKANKYNKNMGLQEKKREICYSAHVDRYIYGYYGFKLNELYNRRLNCDSLNDVPVAYRNNLKKNNIHFSKTAFDFIRNSNNSHIIIGDFTNFFNNLDHKYLKKMLCSLIKKSELPSDFYAVYKNITLYSQWEINHILNLNNLKNTQSDYHKLNNMDRVFSTTKFRKHVKKYISQPTKDTKFGIPQGSSISAVLSNIYMLEFDKKINTLVNTFKGLYMRYSDNFIIVLPKHEKKEFLKKYKLITKIIEETPGLNLQNDKTKKYYYNLGTLTDLDGKSTVLNYLGFSFDGKIVGIRDKTISKYYSRMYRKVKKIVKDKGITKKGNRISCVNLYQKYSIKGANLKNGNFLTYVNRAKKIFGNNEAIDRSTKNHMKKIRQQLNKIKNNE